MGCNDYVIFGTILTLMVTHTPNSTTYNVMTYTDSGCGGSVGILFVDIPRNGKCVANTVMDRCVQCNEEGWGGGAITPSSARDSPPSPPIHCALQPALFITTAPPLPLFYPPPPSPPTPTTLIKILAF